MTDVVQRYLRLGLRFGRLGNGLVDAYFGPADLAEEVAAEPPPSPADIVAQTEALLGELPDGWMRDQVTGVRTYAGAMAGEKYSFADEVAGCYGIRPSFTDESVFEAAHEEMSELLPGKGPLIERYQQWRASQLVPADRVEHTVSAVIAQARQWTEELIALPVGESIELEMVQGVPWGGYCEYLGGLRGRISINADLPRTLAETLHLAIHETYPGHQAERALKDHFLVAGKGHLEETIVLLPTPQSLVSEGLAELAAELVLADAERFGYDIAHAIAVQRAAEPLNNAAVNAAMMRFEAGSTDAELRDYLCRWGLSQEDRADHVIRFLSAPGNRTYVVVYGAGRDLCRSYVDGDLSRFRTLLTEQLRVGDLTKSA